jgi:hypothetical protein
MEEARFADKIPADKIFIDFSFLNFLLPSAGCLPFNLKLTGVCQKSRNNFHAPHHFQPCQFI